MKYVIHAKYDGNKLNGYATQPHRNTVEDKINEALKIILNEDIKISGSARTDSRVHAYDQVAMFETNKKLDLKKFKYSLNSLLTNNIYVFKIYEAHEDFHVRFNMKSKTYLYQITREYNPFLRTYSIHHKKEIDLKKMKINAQKFVGTHDFKAFCASKATTKTTIRTINYINIVDDGDVIKFYINADGFLYNMVRIIIGTLLDINDSKITMSIEEILDSKNRQNAGKTAPPEGLFLYESIYDEDYKIH